MTIWMVVGGVFAVLVGSIGAFRAATASDVSTDDAMIEADVVADLPSGAALVVASSMPVRDVESFAAPRDGAAAFPDRRSRGRYARAGNRAGSEWR